MTLSIHYTKSERTSQVAKAETLLRQLFPRITEAQFKSEHQKFMRMNGDAIATDIFCMQNQFKRQMVNVANSITQM